MTDSDLLLDALDRWNDARANGQSMSPFDLLPERPDLHPELNKQIEKVRLIEVEMEESNPVEQHSHADHADETPDDPGSRVLKQVLSSLDPPGEVDEINRVGDYGILSIVGHGGMGVVLQARHRGTREQVAMKMIFPSGHRPSVRSLRRFRRESRIATSLNHPNLCPVLGTGDIRGLPYLLMPLLAGQSLRDYLRTVGRCTSDELIAIATACTDGLVYLHEKGIVHRDIKPSNLWREPNSPGGIRIIDFGLAKQFEKQHADADGTLTLKDDGPLGTPEYAAPEQLRSETVDGRADMFSLGVVLYQLATGVSPFKANRHYETGLNVISKSPTPLALIRPDLPAELIMAIEALLIKDRNRRPTAKEFRTKHLRPLVGPPGGSPGGETMLHKPTRIRHEVGEWPRPNLTLTRLRSAGVVESWTGVADQSQPVCVSFFDVSRDSAADSTWGRLISFQDLSHPGLALRPDLCGWRDEIGRDLPADERQHKPNHQISEVILVERDYPTRVRHVLDENETGWSSGDALSRIVTLADALDHLHRSVYPTADGPVAITHGAVSEETVAVTPDGLVLCDLFESAHSYHDAGSPADDQADLARLYCQLRVGRSQKTNDSEFTSVATSPLNSMERQAVERATNAKPSERFPSCRSFVRALADRPAPATDTKRTKPSPSLLKRLTGWLPFGQSDIEIRTVVPAGTKPEPLATVDHVRVTDQRLTHVIITVRDASRSVVSPDLIRNNWYTIRPDHFFQVETRLTRPGYTAVYRYDGTTLQVQNDFHTRAMAAVESRSFPLMGWQGPNLLIAVTTPEPITSAAGLMLTNPDPIIIPKWRNSAEVDIGLLDFPNDRPNDPRIARLNAAYTAIAEWFRAIPCVVDVRGLAFAVVRK